jgi:hypothetical protein
MLLHAHLQYLAMGECSEQSQALHGRSAATDDGLCGVILVLANCILLHIYSLPASFQLSRNSRS